TRCYRDRSSDVCSSDLWNRSGSGSGQFTGCTVYTVTVSVTDLDGKTLIPNPIDSTVVNPFKFITVCANPYIINTVPASGETDVADRKSVVQAKRGTPGS